jgi:hypothetical protein
MEAKVCPVKGTWACRGAGCARAAGKRAAARGGWGGVPVGETKSGPEDDRNKQTRGATVAQSLSNAGCRRNRDEKQKARNGFGKVRRACPVSRRLLRGRFNTGWKGRSARSHSQTRRRPLRASVLSNPLGVSRIKSHTDSFLNSSSKTKKR